jgi:uncharacterized protein DUF1570
MATEKPPINSRLTRFGAAPWLVLATLSVLCFVAGPADAQELKTFQSRHYLIHTSLKADEVRPFGEHMDTVFVQFQDRFREFKTRGNAHMPLYLFRTEAQYQQFMRSQNINATNTGGMFFYSPKSQGLATWVQGRSRSQTFQVLQHEGFHQFGFNYLGQELPIWMNEGLAQYFEDAIIVGERMTTGHANARRVEQVRSALKNDRAMDFADVIALTTDDWNKTLQGDPADAALMYAQAWSVTFFLIHGDDERYQSDFARYLQKVSTGQDSQAAFHEAFGARDMSPMARRWKNFAAKQTPDPLNTAASRMEFLGEALRFIQDKGEPTPRTLGLLRTSLHAKRFVLTRKAHGVTIEMDATDPDLYRYQRRNGSTGLFRLLEPTRDDLPPRITAPGLSPEPTLVWSRDANGKLVQDIEYR